MARAFTSSGDNLRTTNVLAATSAGTVGCWIRPNYNGDDGVYHPCWVCGDLNSNRLPGMEKANDNNLYVGFYTGASQWMVIAATTLFTAGVWDHHLLTWDDAADEEFYYHNAAQQGSRLTTLTTSLSNGLTIGNFPSGETQFNADAAFAEWARWNRVLTAEEIALLAAGFSPLFIPDGLVDYYRVLGQSPEPSVVSPWGLTVTGSAVVAHPPVLYPAPPHLGLFFDPNVFSPAFASARALAVDPAIFIGPELARLRLTWQVDTAFRSLLRLTWQVQELDGILGSRLRLRWAIDEHLARLRLTWRVHDADLEDAYFADPQRPYGRVSVA